MKEAIAKAPDHPVLNYHLGIAYHKAGHAKEAKAFLEKAVASGHAFPGVEDARTVLAELKG
ncbi:MAG: tetratricopeptide repeat protein [Nitrospiraceae bacterium]